MNFIEKRFGTFTHYCITVQELIANGFSHTNENYSTVKKGSKCFTTVYAGSTMIAVVYPETFSKEVDEISKTVFDKIQARKRSDMKISYAVVSLVEVDVCDRFDDNQTLEKVNLIRSFTSEAEAEEFVSSMFEQIASGLEMEIKIEQLWSKYRHDDRKVKNKDIKLLEAIYSEISHEQDALHNFIFAFQQDFMYVSSFASDCYNLKIEIRKQYSRG